MRLGDQSAAARQPGLKDDDDDRRQRRVIAKTAITLFKRLLALRSRTGNDEGLITGS